MSSIWIIGPLRVVFVIVFHDSLIGAEKEARGRPDERKNCTVLVSDFTVWYHKSPGS